MFLWPEGKTALRSGSRGLLKASIGSPPHPLDPLPPSWDAATGDRRSRGHPPGGRGRPLPPLFRGSFVLARRPPDASPRRALGGRPPPPQQLPPPAHALAPLFEVGRELSGRLLLVPREQRRERPDGQALVELGHLQLDAEHVLQAREHLHGDQGVAPQLEEVVV